MTDHDDIKAAELQMNRTALSLAAMSNDVADAKTVKEFSNDRLKRAFSVAVAIFLGQGESVSGSEHKARASAGYGSNLHDLEEQYKTAMRVIEKYDGLRVQWESFRSIVSLEKAKLGLL